MKKLFIGIDNGVTGSIGVLGEKEDFIQTPVKKVFKYTKKKSQITRVDYVKLKEYFTKLLDGYSKDEVIVALERPMVNPKRFVSTSSALRCWEAILILMDELELPYDFIDSKEWQKSILPKGVKGEELKSSSLQIGNRLYPKFKDVKSKDRDGLLIALYYKNKEN